MHQLIGSLAHWLIQGATSSVSTSFSVYVFTKRVSHTRNSHQNDSNLLANHAQAELALRHHTGGVRETIGRS